MLRYIEIDLLGKKAKNHQAFVSCKVERNNDFVELKYKDGVLVVLSKMNSLFIFKDLVLVYQITNFDILNNANGYLDSYYTDLSERR